MGWLSVIPVVGKFFDGLFNTIDEAIEDKDKANELKAQIETAMSNADLEKFTQQMKSQENIIISEATGKSWLQRNWRPGLMTLFGVIIFNNYILNPWLSLMFNVEVVMDIPPQMWELLKLGVGGYVVGRSLEKGIKHWKGKE